jgi:hypothetical protein
MKRSHNHLKSPGINNIEIKAFIDFGSDCSVIETNLIDVGTVNFKIIEYTSKIINEITNVKLFDM